MKRLAAKGGIAVLCGLAMLVLAPAQPVLANGMSATVAVGSAAPGDSIRVTGSGWPAQQLIQLVTCGELALNGSGSCDMLSALATTTRADGTFIVDLQVGKPPKPCPCVVHVALVGVGSQGQVDVPLGIKGHPIADLPKATAAPASVEVVDVRLDGGGGWAEWFGGEADRTLVYTVRNSGTQAMPNPTLRVRVGKGDGGETVKAPPPGELKAGETRTFEVPVTFPIAAFGHYEVRAELSGLGAAVVAHEAYPWGLVVLNVIGIVLIGLGVVRRLRQPRSRPAAAGGDLPHASGELLLSSVVRVPALHAYLVFDDAPGVRRLRRLAASRISAYRLRALLADPEPATTSAVSTGRSSAETGRFGPHGLSGPLGPDREHDQDTVMLPRIVADAARDRDDEPDSTAVIDVQALDAVLAQRYPKPQEKQ